VIAAEGGAAKQAWHPQAPPVPDGRHCVPVGQSPSQSGPLASPHGIGGCLQEHPSPTMSGVQRRPSAQFPLQAGAACWAQSRTGGAQKQLPVPAVHTSSPGQSPPQAGKPDRTQGTVSGSQRQIVPAGSLAQVCPAGQLPPHAGAAEAVHGV
jgi:hypothetical protein